MEERRFNYANRKKNRCYSREPYRLPRECWPGLLTDEFTSYEQWRVEAFVPGRPARLRQRPATFAGTVIEFECFFGYLIHVAERNPSSLCLADICDPDALRAYAAWHVENRTGGRPSRFIEKTLTDFLVCARHYLETDSEVIDAIAALKAEWDPPLVRDKRARWNSLATLEAVGLAEYPKWKTISQQPVRCPGRTAEPDHSPVGAPAVAESQYPGDEAGAQPVSGTRWMGNRIPGRGVESRATQWAGECVSCLVSERSRRCSGRVFGKMATTVKHYQQRVCVLVPDWATVIPGSFEQTGDKSRLRAHGASY